MNKKKTAHVRSNIAGILAVLWMMVIFFFSAQDKEESGAVSESFSDHIVSTADRLLHLDIDEERLHEIALAIEGFVRKGAHMTEYAILAILLYVWTARWLTGRMRRYCMATVLAVLYACSDEFHQLFVAGRAGRISDVIVDGAGAILGLAFFLLIQSGIMRWSEKRRRRTEIQTSERLG